MSKDLRNAESEWRGMTSSHRQHAKPYLRTKGLKVLRVLKIMALITILVLIANFLYEGKRACEGKLGTNSIICID